ncbi:PspC domain-containing protein [Acidipropionibacterium jensenii]|uniref:PspC domain-containing protein n=1 Tax=Acidipropionibacterium jensenii TaxID=1749 RepID=UPI001386616C|nr:PspC domain-containing protein [Acidipropionibacterium jensenii]
MTSRTAPPTTGRSGSVSLDIGAPTRSWQQVQRSDQRVAGGVCRGLARYWDVDPLLVRVLAALLALSAGIGVVLYAAAWVLMPTTQGRSIADQRTPRLTRLRGWQMTVLLIAVWALAMPVLGHLTPFGVGPVVVLAIGYWLVRRARRRAAVQSPTSPSPLIPAASDTDAHQTLTHQPDDQTQGQIGTGSLATFDPYRPTVETPARPDQFRRSWLLLLAMVVLSGIAMAVGIHSPVPHPLILGLALAVAVMAGFQVIGVWTRRPHLGVTLGLAATLALTGTVAVSQAGLPSRVASGTAASMVWTDAADLPADGVTVMAAESTIDASDLTLSRDRITTVAVVGSDVTIVMPRQITLSLLTETTGGTVSRPDGTELLSGGSDYWTGPREPGAATWTLKLRVIGANVKVVTS